MKNLILLLAGAFGGIAFVLACSDRMSAGDDAHAAPNDCAAWAIVSISLGELPTGQEVVFNGSTSSTWDLPPGWEPFAHESGGVYARRCRP